MRALRGRVSATETGEHGCNCEEGEPELCSGSGGESRQTGGRAAAATWAGGSIDGAPGSGSDGRPNQERGEEERAGSRREGNKKNKTRRVEAVFRQNTRPAHERRGPV